MSERIGVVCIGAGWVTAHRHIPALLRDGRASIVGVVDVHADRARALARRHRLPHWATDLEAPWIAEAACASVGTPPASHAAVVRSLLERGLHVLCEKPLAMTPDEAQTLVACAERRGRRLAVVHNFQFARSTLRARRLLEAGDLGALTAVYALQLSNPSRRLPHWYPSLPGGLFYDEAPHLAYLLRSVLGDLVVRSAGGRADKTASGVQVLQVDAVFDHPTCWAQLTMNFAAPLSEWQLVLVGTRKLIAVDIFRDVSVLLPSDGRHDPPAILRTTLVGVGQHLAGVVRSGLAHVTGRLLYGNDEVVRRFLDAVTGAGDLGGIDGRDGLAVVRILHDILGRLPI